MYSTQLKRSNKNTEAPTFGTRSKQPTQKDIMKTLDPNLRDPLDFDTTNTVLQESVQAAFQLKQPETFGDHTIEISDVQYPAKRTFSKKDQKKAILQQSEMSLPLRGTITLKNKDSGEVLDQKRTTLMRVPYLTDRGTFIRNGGDYTLALQKRLRSGVYTRKTNAGEFETFVKTKDGTGFNIMMDPDVGKMYLKVYNSKTPIYSVLRSLGMDDEAVKNTLGKDLYKSNKIDNFETPASKLLKKITRGKNKTEDIAELKEVFSNMSLDPETTARTLGSPYDRVTPDVFKSAITSLLETYRGNRETDNRDSLSFQEVLGPEDYFSEGILKDKGRILSKLLYKAQQSKNLNHLHANVFGPVVDHIFYSSRLGLSPEEISPLDAIDSNVKITGMGTGGFMSSESVPDSSRQVQETQFGLIDATRSPECHRADITEVLAESGWTPVTEVTGDTKLACQVDGQLEFHEPSRLINEYYEGELYTADINSVSYSVTPNHRMWVKSDLGTCGYKFKTVTDVHGGHEDGVYKICPYKEIEGIVPKQFMDVEYYTGDVWCATVPGGLLYTRCGGTGGFWSGNSSAVGVDSRLAINTYKGLDGKLYGRFMDPAGKEAYLSNAEIEDYVIAFPGEMEKVKASKGLRKLYAIDHGKMGYVYPRQVDYILPTGQEMFSLEANLVPALSNVKGMRTLMGSKYSITGDSKIIVKRASGEIFYGLIEDYTWQSGDTAPSIDKETLESGWRPVSGVSKHEHDCKIFEVRTSSGRSVKATDHHSFVQLVRTGDDNRQRKMEKIFTEDLCDTTVIPAVESLDIQHACPMYFNFVVNNETRLVELTPKNAFIFGALYALSISYAPVGSGILKVCPEFPVHCADLGIPLTLGKLSTHCRGVLHTIIPSITERLLNSPEKSRLSFLHGLLAHKGRTHKKGVCSLTALVPSRDFEDLAVLFSSVGFFVIKHAKGKEQNDYYDLRVVDRNSWLEKLRTINIIKPTSMEVGHTSKYSTAHPGVAADHVVSVTEVKEEFKYVYDLHMDDNVFWCCGGIVVHNTNQSVSMPGREVPRVQTMTPDGSSSFQRELGKKVGGIIPDRPGVVHSVTDDEIVLRYDDGTTEKHELYNNLPLNRKSVSGDSRICILREGCILRMQISEYSMHPGDLVRSIDPDSNSSAWMPVTNFYGFTCDKKMYRVMYKTGRHVDVTEDHGLITMDADGSICPIEPKDVVTNVTQSPLTTLKAPGAQKHNTVGDGLATLAGLYLSDGHTSESQPGAILFTTETPERRRQVTQLLQREAADGTTYDFSKYVCLVDYKVNTWLKTNFGVAHKQRCIPDMCFNWPESERSAFLSGFFAGEYGVHAEAPDSLRLYGCAYSSTFRDSLIDFLGMFGVHLYKAPLSGEQQDVLQSGDYNFYIRLSDVCGLGIPFFYDDKQEQLSELVDAVYTSASCDMDITRAINTEELLEYFSSGLPTVVPTEDTRPTDRSDTALRADFQRYKDSYGKWAHSDVQWDTVIDVREIPRPERVYDLSVGGSEAFCVNGGLLVHNSFYHQTPTIGVGERFEAGQAVVDSNFTKGGVLAQGTHLRTAYMPFKGYEYEDAMVISESASKKLLSEHMITKKVDLDKNTSTDLGQYASIFPGVFSEAQLENITDQGVARPGTVLKDGDPIILSMTKSKHKGSGMVSSGKKSRWTDNTVLWDKHYDGVVTDSWEDSSGINVSIKSYVPMSDGDKMCFTPDHEVFTENRGWVYVGDVDGRDVLSSLNLETLKLETMPVRAVHKYEVDERLIVIAHPDVSTMITQNHKIVASYDGLHFELLPVRKVFLTDVFWMLSGGSTLPIMVEPEKHMRFDTYTGCVVCPEIGENHTLLVRHADRIHWSGNSNIHGGKGVISRVVPDDQMVKDEQGRPVDVILNPLGVIGRHNPSQIVEALLAKTGEEYILPAFSDEDRIDFVAKELDKHGISPTETLTLPEGRKVHNVLVGDAYMLKLHHMAADKESGVGEAGFTMSGVPTATPDSDKPKRIGTLEVDALIAYGAPKLLQDIKLIRGQENREYFKDLMDGKNPPMPKITPTYKKFMALMRSAGINIRPDEQTQSLQLVAMTDEDVENISSGELKSGESVKWKSSYGKNLRGESDLDPVPGGLFDRGITGGMGGNRFSHITLPSKVPQPVYEKSIRSLLGVTQKTLEGILAGRETLNGLTGSKALETALGSINVDHKLEELTALYKTTERVSVKDKIAKQLKALNGLKNMGKQPTDLLVSKVLVIPPKFRPISITEDFEIIADANMLYKDLVDARNNYTELSDVVDDEMSGSAFLDMYKAYKAVTGLGTPIKRDRVEKNVKGLLSEIFGPTGNKTSIVQRQLLGTPTTYSGRGVITPDPNLTMDELGIPEDRAWDMFRPHVIRRMIKRTTGDPLSKKQVLMDVENKRPNARRALLEEMAERPVLYSRAPVLHKYGVLAGMAKPVPGKAIRLSPAIEPGIGGDHDGDATRTMTLVKISIDKFPEIRYYNAINTNKGDNMLSTKVKMALKENEEIYYVNIEDFPHCGDPVKSYPGRFGEVTVYAVPEGVEVLAFDEESREQKWAQPSFWSIHRDLPLEIVTLSSGRQLITDDDPLGVYGVVPKEGSLRTTTDTPMNAKLRDMLVPYNRKQSLLGGDLDTISLPANTLKIDRGLLLKDTLNLNFNSGYFMGAVAGDGWGSDAQVCLANIEDGIKELFIKSLTEYLTTVPPVGHIVNKSGSWGRSEKTVVNSKMLSNLVTTSVGRGCANKHLPYCFLSANREYRQGLLSGLLDTDGTVSWVSAKSKKLPQLQIAFTSTSIRLIEETQLLCSSLGIRAHITAYKPRSENRRKSWSLALVANDVKESGIVLQHKAKADNLNSYEYKESPASIRHDQVPITKDLLDYIKSETNKLGDKYASDEWKRLKKTIAGRATPAKFNGLIPRATAETVIEACGRQYLSGHEQGDSWLKMVDNREVSWTPIHAVEQPGIRETGYDLCVPGYETFTAVDGVIRHNTIQLHAVISDDAVREVKEKLLPSRNLFSVSDFKLLHTPHHVFNLGLTMIDNNRNKGKLVTDRQFSSPEAVMAAYSRGDIDLADEVVVDDVQGS